MNTALIAIDSSKSLLIRPYAVAAAGVFAEEYQLRVAAVIYRKRPSLDAILTAITSYRIGTLVIPRLSHIDGQTSAITDHADLLIMTPRARYTRKLMETTS